MNSLQKQTAAFKARRAAQPIFKRPIINRNVQNNTNNEASKLHNKIFEARRLKSKADAIDLPVAGTKRKLDNHQIFEVIEYLKTVDEPQTDEDLKKYAKVDIYSSKNLYDNLTDNPKITFDPEAHTFAYKPEYDIRSKEELLVLLKQNKAMVVKELEDSHLNVIEAVKELEAAGDILVIYDNSKEKKKRPKFIYENDKNLNVETDQVFKDLWHSLKVPAAADISSELEKAGLKSMEVFETKVNPKNKMKKKSKQRNRKVKITNTHLEGIDLTKDYEVEKK